MKLEYRGIIKSVETLPKTDLPENAVKFKEPETLAAVNKAALFYMVPLAAFICLCVYLGVKFGGKTNPLDTPLYPGAILALLSVLPHELLHAVCFGKDAVVGLYFAPKELMAFVFCSKPISKARFIFLSLCPNLVLGWLPFMLWLILPDLGKTGSNLLIFSVYSILMGAGDFMNAVNAIRQMPNGSYQQLSGMHSYWFMP
ncbi:MAG TPA: DUF3267 domain-containing protein [Clostridiales bacterium]|mgnify:FL=1|nr:DUF3267 domain-containing protein [Clostridiales bacterium]